MTKGNEIFVHGQIVAICKAILNEEIGIIAGARRLQAIRFEFSDELDEDFLIFIAIDSETDHLPVDKERRNWSSEALARKDIEILEYESFYRENVLSQCKKLVERFEYHRL